MAISTPETIEKLEKHLAPILIVDDKLSLTHSLRRSLEQSGFNVLFADSKESGMEYLREKSISIIITFHKPKGTSGLELLVHAKKHNPHTERILIHSEPLPHELLEQVRPAECISSLFEENTLLQTINESFERFSIKFEHEKMATLLTQNKIDLSNAKDWIHSEHLLGKKIHQLLLIDSPPKDLPGISIIVSSYTSNALDGDFVAFFRPSKHLLDISMGDVMGKGLPSALVGTAIKGEISRIADPFLKRSLCFDHREFWKEDHFPIKEIIQNVHQSYVERLLNLEYYISLFYGRLDIAKRTLTFIDCGFTKPLYFRKGSEKGLFINSSNFPLGTVKYHEYSPFEVQYEEGDFFILHSDGITEAISKEGELFGEKRLMQIIEKNHHLPTEELSNKIREEVVQFTGQDFIEDDFTLMIIKIDELYPQEMNKQGSAKFNSVLTQLMAVRTHTREMCLKAPGDVERLSSELQLAIDEVFTNIVLHGYGKKPGSPICIHAEYFKDELVIEISDQGIVFNPFEVPPINLLGDQDHGYGWHLIRQIADRIVYTPKQHQNGWNYLKIYKRYYIRRDNQMELTTLQRDGVLILRLDSETLDAKQAQGFKEKAIQIISQKGNDQVIFDLQKLQFIDSSGLGAFLSLLRQINTRGGRLCLAGMTPPVKTIFELVSMQKIFECCDTIDQAIHHLTEAKK